MRAVFVIVATVLSLSSISYAEQECPVKTVDDNYVENVIKAIRSKASCEEASSVAELCAFGNGLDPEFTVVAERKCGLDFWQKLSATDKKAYNGLQAKCNSKYGKMEGTMYISFAGFCRLSVARLYSNLFTPAEM